MPPGYTGSRLDAFEEVGDYDHGLERSIRLSDLNTVPTDEQKAAAEQQIQKQIQKLIQRLPAIEALLPEIGVYFVFYTS